MEQVASIEAIAQVIQLAVAPVFLLAGRRAPGAEIRVPPE
jgi:hypothetical protein